MNHECIRGSGSRSRLHCATILICFIHPNLVDIYLSIYFTCALSVLNQLEITGGSGEKQHLNAGMYQGINEMLNQMMLTMSGLKNELNDVHVSRPRRRALHIVPVFTPFPRVLFSERLRESHC